MLNISGLGVVSAPTPQQFEKALACMEAAMKSGNFLAMESCSTQNGLAVDGSNLTPEQLKTAKARMDAVMKVVAPGFTPMDAGTSAAIDACHAKGGMWNQLDLKCQPATGCAPCPPGKICSAGCLPLGPTAPPAPQLGRSSARTGEKTYPDCLKAGGTWMAMKTDSASYCIGGKKPLVLDAGPVLPPKPVAPVVVVAPPPSSGIDKKYIIGGSVLALGLGYLLLRRPR